MDMYTKPWISWDSLRFRFGNVLQCLALSSANLCGVTCPRCSNCGILAPVALRVKQLSVLRIVGPKCTLAALHAGPWWVTVNIPTGQTDRRTDAIINPIKCRFHLTTKHVSTSRLRSSYIIPIRAWRLEWLQVSSDIASGSDGQPDRRTDARPLHYAFCYGRCQHDCFKF